MMLQIDDDRIYTVWGWCSEAYLRYGKRLTFPKFTEPTETYQWQFAKAIALKFIDWKFDDATSITFIDVAVEYAKQHGLLYKGLSILHQKNMMEICYEKLKTKQVINHQSIDVLLQTKKWIDKEISNNQDKLLERSSKKALCNLTIWYQASKISPLYLSLSKMCSKALNQLPTHEREYFPKSTSLYLMRTKFLNCDSHRNKALQILKEDLIKHASTSK